MAHALNLTGFCAPYTHIPVTDIMALAESVVLQDGSGKLKQYWPEPLRS